MAANKLNVKKGDNVIVIAGKVDTVLRQWRLMVLPVAARICVFCAFVHHIFLFGVIITVVICVLCFKPTLKPLVLLTKLWANQRPKLQNVL